MSVKEMCERLIAAAKIEDAALRASVEVFGMITDEARPLSTNSTLLRSAASMLEEMEKERDALAAFKSYVHERLDAAGITKEPNGPHSAAGCRIGDRLDEILRFSVSIGGHAKDARLRALEEENAKLREALEPFAEEASAWPDHCLDDDCIVTFHADDFDAATHGEQFEYRDNITVGDLRRARALLSPGDGGGE